MFHRDKMIALLRAGRSPLLLIILAATGLAQSELAITDGATPASLSPGSPTSSYPLSNFEHYSPYTGKPNIAIPLHHIGGRGAAGYDLFLSSISPHWTAEWSPGSPGAILTPVAVNWPPYQPGYGPGTMFLRSALQVDLTCQSGLYAQYSLTRLTFTAADGTETELRDTATDGSPYTIPNPCNSNPSSWDAGRGTVFTSRDGSQMTFVSDSRVLDYNYVAGDVQVLPVWGYLHFRDGTTYRFDNGHVSWIRDRNGNKISFTYDSQNRLTIVTDQDNRQVTIAYKEQTQFCSGGAAFCDYISFSGFGVNRTIEVDWDYLHNSFRSGYSLQTLAALYPETVSPNNPENYQWDTSVISYVRYADSSKFQFQYNSYGEVARIILPTGGAIEYDMSGAFAENDGFYGDATRCWIDRRLWARREYANGGTSKTGGASYSYQYLQNGNVYTQITTEQFQDANGNTIAQTVHNFGGSASEAFAVLGIGYSNWQDGLETQTQLGYPATSKTQAYTWQQGATTPWCRSQSGTPYDCNPYNTPPENPQKKNVRTTLNDTNQVSCIDYAYDQYNNVASKTEHDYGACSVNDILRQTSTTYKTDTAYVDPGVNLVSLPTQATITDAGGAQWAQTQWTYDTPPALQNEPYISNLDQSVTYRGNVTSLRRWLTGGSYVATTASYDIAGNMVSLTDPLGNITGISWADPPFYTYASPTSITNPLSQATTYQYDALGTGKVTLSTDANSVQTSYLYQDPLDRLIKVRRSAGSSECSGTSENESNSSYPNPTTVNTNDDLNSCGDQTLTSSTVYDGFGRQKQRMAPGSIYVDTTYDALGRVYQISNPYQSGETEHYTTYAYDSLGRVTSVATDDGSHSSISYSGNASTFTDPAGKSRTVTTDALGRIRQVTDATGTTTYTYDPLDDLIGVNQSGQVRSFTYDSLRRLTCASNPERRSGSTACPAQATSNTPLPSSGVDLYQYDADGNLTTHTDARSISTQLAYDKLNRVIQKTYSDSTPRAVYCYDGNTTATNYNGSVNVTCTGSTQLPAGANAKGHLTWENNGNSSTAFTNFDPMGRILVSTQTTAGVPYPFSYTYNLAGLLTIEIYPSYRLASTSYDSAGRPNQVSSGGTNYVTQVQYASHGPIKQATFGSGLKEVWTFDPVRQQPWEINVAPAGGGQAWLDLKYYYCSGQQPPAQPSSCSSNNGNVWAEGINSIAGLNVTQLFTYDGANRLASANENSSANWWESYSYDSFGNRAVSGSTTGWDPVSTPTSLQYTNNRWIRGSGDQYDAAGNQLRVASNGNPGVSANIYTFDAENRMTSSNVANMGQVLYLYDSDGKRVRKTAGYATTTYVYDAAGQLAAEYSTQQAAVDGTSYLTADALGSTRLVSTMAGIRLYDYLPFGQYIPQGIGGRPGQYPAAGYLPTMPDVESIKMTGKERDAEAGLDYFGARYFSGAQGRFTTPDPLMASARASNPQTWNRYGYALNNPLRYVDPDGLEVPEECAEDPNCTIKVKLNVVYDQTVNRGTGLTAEQKKQFEQGQIAKAQRDFGTSNIKLDVTYTAGSYTVDQSTGLPQLAGLRSDALNLVISNATPNGAAGVSGVDKNTDVAVTFLNFNEVHDWNAYPLFTNTTEHELGHQFLGDPYLPTAGGIGGFFQYLGREGVVDSRVAGQAAGISQQGFRTGLEPRRYAVPLNPEANKPRQ